MRILILLLAVVAAHGQISPPPTNAPSGAAGGNLSGTYPNPVVAKINGTTVAANAAANQVPLTTAAAVTAWTGIPSCLDSAGQHLNFNTTTHAFSCGTSGGVDLSGVPAGSVLMKTAGVVGGAPIKAATSAELAGVDLVTNGNFSSGLSGWTVDGDGTGWSIVSGHLHHTPGQANKISTNVTVVLGDTYFQLVQVLSQSAGSAYVDLGVDCNSDCGPSLIVGSNVWDLTASPDSGATVIEIQPDADSDITISSIAILHGFSSIYLPALGNSNTVLGPLAMRDNTTGFSNAAFGPFALASNTGGSFNTAIGMSAGLFNTGSVASANTAVGAFSLINNSSGNANTAVGRYSLNGNVSGSNNTFVGVNSGTTKPDIDQAICVGFACQVNLDKHTVIGNSDTIETLLYGLIREAPHTPASSSEACTAGQFSADTNYFYECISSNLWKSAPLLPFQTSLPSDPNTVSNCSSAASPAVCASAAAGSVAIPTGTNPTLVVNTTKVTANSQILLQSDDTLGTKLSTTCNSTLASLAAGIVVTARTAGTSFTITFNGVLATNPLCLSYAIIN